MTQYRATTLRGKFAKSAILLGVLTFAGPLSAAAADLSLKRVVLSSGGLGYFEFHGRAEGDDAAIIELPLSQVDDVLKSIVVDDSGGRPSVELVGRNALDEIFRNLPFRPNHLMSGPTLLNALQGAQVRIYGAEEIVGRVLRAVRERAQLPDRQGVVNRHRLSVMTASGLRHVIVEDVDRIEFADPNLSEQIEQALVAIEDHGKSDRRRLRIRFPGSGGRAVSVGYTVPMPLWKVSYRLLTTPEGETARLQGWALIDNLSGQDWRDVELALTSGNPVTYRQDLYGAYYVERSVLPVEVMGRVLPRRDEGAVAATGAERRKGDSSDDPARPTPKRTLGFANAVKQSSRAMEDRAQVEAAAAPPPGRAANQTMVAAESGEAMAQVAYRFEGLQTLAHGYSAMLPLVDRNVPATALLLYEPSTHARFPLAVVALKNDGESSLPPGLVTIYGAGTVGGQTFVGDAQLSLLPKKQKRMLSYALDRRMTVDRSTSNKRQILSGKVSGGVVRLSVRQETHTVYRIKSVEGEARRLVLQHPRVPGWELQQPSKSDVELTDKLYRMSVLPKPGETLEFSVVLGRPIIETLRLADLKGNQLAYYVKQGQIGPELRAIFENVATLRRAVTAAREKVERLNGEQKAIFDDQGRIRDNLRRLNNKQPLYARYLKKLESQEDRLEALEVERDKAQESLRQAETELRDYVAGVTL